jgi:hypothetical protein
MLEKYLPYIAYFIGNLITLFVAIYLQRRYKMKFGFSTGTDYTDTVWMIIIGSFFIWPVVLTFVYPYVIAQYFINKK